MQADVVGTGAAMLAALMSGLTLWFSAARDERKWRRDALVNVLATFMDASFGRPGNIAYRLRLSGSDLSEIRQASVAAQARQTEALTRLRLLAGRNVVESAVALFDIENSIQEMVLSAPQLPNEKQWVAMYEKRRAARTALLTAARSSLGLGRTRPVEAGLHRPLPTPGESIDSVFPA